MALVCYDALVLWHIRPSEFLRMDAQEQAFLIACMQKHAEETQKARCKIRR